MQDLGIRATFSFNNLLIKSAFPSLTSLKQENVTIEGNSFYTITDIKKLFYIKSSSSLIIKLTPPTNIVQTFSITDSLLLTGVYNSVRLENPSSVTGDRVEVFIVSS